MHDLAGAALLSEGLVRRRLMGGERIHAFRSVRGPDLAAQAIKPGRPSWWEAAKQSLPNNVRLKREPRFAFDLPPAL